MKAIRYQDDFSQIFKDYFVSKLQSFENALKTNYEKSGEFPTRRKHLCVRFYRRTISISTICATLGERPIKSNSKTTGTFTILVLKTASADKKFGTEDDFTVKEMRFEWFSKTAKSIDDNSQQSHAETKSSADNPTN